MQKFKKCFGLKKCIAIGMIHVDPLPGTPKYQGSFERIIEKACYEANLYSKHGLDAIMIENMHDIPYVQSKEIGPETISCMTRIAVEVKRYLKQNIPCGIQVLASANKEAISIAKACNFQFIRCEGFVFGHIADEGYTNACAGTLLRYRRIIDGDNILIFTDIKKKHSSHTITADINLLETIKSAELFLTDGIILTGTATGIPVDTNDLITIQGKVKTPIFIGSGVSCFNLPTFFNQCDAVIIGSYFKKDNYWKNELCERNINSFMKLLNDLRGTNKKKV